ncbi:hypothetical protein V5P93_004320 [Actinokineospora auranticolor]|uniref:hypothetical protein n=1 Tax=Actinokineospora auranticolor TaxID=155976 RepID=UPI0015E2956C|nr:hypothetical protein [Actinokineospora auranticolor]
MTGHSNAVERVMFVDDTTLASASTDGSIRLWSLDPEVAVARACAILRSPTFDQEWSAIMPDQPHGCPR